MRIVERERRGFFLVGVFSRVSRAKASRKEFNFGDVVTFLWPSNLVEMATFNNIIQYGPKWENYIDLQLMNVYVFFKFDSNSSHVRDTNKSKT